MVEKGNLEKEEKITFNIDKEKNFSEWYTEIIKAAELADLRYNVKGFIVYQPWAFKCMREMFRILEEVLERKGHQPYRYPVVIPEKNFFLESEHVEGFAPEVFWITEAGEEKKLEEKLALRPTSETAFYQMFSLWIRSYKDLPFKTYQRASIYRYETKATRPFLRSREVWWIEAHDAFATEKDALNQVKEDMETTREVLFESFCVPFHFFERPQWDKFAGSVKSFAADVLMPDGKVVQQPSTHFLGQNFSKAFNVKFRDKDGIEKFAYLTCYGPAPSRIFASVIALHGDNKGLVFPFAIAPLQVIIIPINSKKNAKLDAKVKSLVEDLRKQNLRVEVDESEKSLGNKFFYWEMKGVPIRIELGEKELKKGKALLYRRDSHSKELVALKQLPKKVLVLGKAIDDCLRKKAAKRFDELTVEAKNFNEIKKLIAEGKIVKANFCSIGEDAFKCAERVEKESEGSIRGIRLDEKQLPKGNCIVCGKKANVVVYIAKAY